MFTGKIKQNLSQKNTKSRNSFERELNQEKNNKTSEKKKPEVCTLTEQPIQYRQELASLCRSIFTAPIWQLWNLAGMDERLKCCLIKSGSCSLSKVASRSSVLTVDCIRDTVDLRLETADQDGVFRCFHKLGTEKAELKVVPMAPGVWAGVLNSAAMKWCHPSAVSSWD